MLQAEALVARFRFDTVENELPDVELLSKKYRDASSALQFFFSVFAILINL